MPITHSVEEAIYLSSRVVVVSARHSRVRCTVEVPFPYPRTEQLHENAEFLELDSRVRDLVLREYAAQERQTREAAPH